MYHVEARPGADRSPTVNLEDRFARDRYATDRADRWSEAVLVGLVVVPAALVIALSLLVLWSE